LPEDRARYVAEKGSIAVNGISLTIAEVKPASFVTWIIPHTRRCTNLKNARSEEHTSELQSRFDLVCRLLLEKKKKKKKKTNTDKTYNKTYHVASHIIRLIILMCHTIVVRFVIDHTIL